MFDQFSLRHKEYTKKKNNRYNIFLIIAIIAFGLIGTSAVLLNFLVAGGVAIPFMAALPGAVVPIALTGFIVMIGVGCAILMHNHATELRKKRSQELNEKSQEQICKDGKEFVSSDTLDPVRDNLKTKSSSLAIARMSLIGFVMLTTAALVIGILEISAISGIIPAGVALGSTVAPVVLSVILLITIISAGYIAYSSAMQRQKGNIELKTEIEKQYEFSPEESQDLGVNHDTLLARDQVPPTPTITQPIINQPVFLQRQQRGMMPPNQSIFLQRQQGGMMPPNQSVFLQRQQGGPPPYGRPSTVMNNTCAHPCYPSVVVIQENGGNGKGKERSARKGRW